MLTPWIRIVVLTLLFAGASVESVNHNSGSWMIPPPVSAGTKTTADVLIEIGPAARSRMIPHFNRADSTYPPDQVTFLAIKDSAELEIWVESESRPTYIRTLTIRKLSGISGPKLREGDKQIPEGIYAIEALNPNSNYHLSMKLIYPNAFDLTQAIKEGRTRPGSNIFIHGKSRSIGCLAMGDKVIEELFVMAADVGIEKFKVIIAPGDPRQNELVAPVSPTWVKDLYTEISIEFSKYNR